MTEIRSTKAPGTSKTIVANSTLFAVYTIAKWINPELEIPDEVLVALTTLGNIWLRLLTKLPIGG